MYYDQLTLQIIIDAIRKNGLQQAYGRFFELKNTKIIKACALGQAAINIDPENPKGVEIQLALNDIGRYLDLQLDVSLGNYVVDLNDVDKLSFAKIADKLESLIPVESRNKTLFSLYEDTIKKTLKKTQENRKLGNPKNGG